MKVLTWEEYLRWAVFYRDTLDFFIAPVQKPIVGPDKTVASTFNGKEKYYKVMPIGYKGRHNGKDDYLRAVSDEEVREWYDQGYGLAVITKGWSYRFKKYQRIFDLDAFGTLTKGQFWKKYASALGNNFVTESFKGYHLFVFSNTPIEITKFTIETPQGDTFTGELRYGTKSGHTVEPPSLSVDDSKWVIRGRYEVANITDEPGELPAGWEVTNYSTTKKGREIKKVDETIDVMRSMLEGKTKKGQGQGVYDMNLQQIGREISKIKDKEDIEAVQKALDKSLAFNKKHALGYDDSAIKDTFFSVLKKDVKKEKMNRVELDLETIKKAGGSIIQDSSDERVYIQIDGKHNHLLDSAASRRWIIQALEPKDTAQVSNVVMRLDAAIEKRVHLQYRVARNADNALCYNIADEAGRIVSITPKGWECTPSPDICLFKPASGERVQMLPIRGGTLEEIFDFINIKPSFRPLFLCLLVYYFIPDVQYPILALYGAKGSGKSTVASFLRLLIDPNEAEFDSVDNKKIEDARVALSASYLSVIDNLSHISQEMSDLLCLFSTGGAYRKRALYTDGDVHLSQIVKPLILTSVTQEIRREDLLSRTVLIEVEKLSKKETPTSLKTRFKQRVPSILGAIFDVISQIEVDTAPREDLVRMADFHIYSRAISKILGFENKIDELLQNNFETQEEEAIGNSDIGDAIRNFMADKAEYEATAAEWIAKLSENDYTMRKKQPNWFARDVRRLAETLQAVGLEVSFPSRMSSKKTIFIKNKRYFEGVENEDF